MRILYFAMKHVYCVMGCLLNLDYAMTFGDKRPKHASYLYWAISHDEKQLELFAIL